MLKKYVSNETRTFDLILVKNYGQADKDTLEQDYRLDPSLLEYVADKNGPARIESDDSLEETIIVFWVPISERTHSQPVSLIFHEKQLFVFLNDKMTFIHEALMTLLKETSADRIDFVLDFLLLTMTKYIEIISNLSAGAERIQAHLNSHRSNKNFENLTHVNQDVVYLRSAIKENSDSFSDLPSFFKDTHIRPSSTETRKMRKLNIALQQSSRMIDLISENVEQLSDAYDRLINNDLNSIMRFLTIWSLLLAVPPIVSGFYGMNMHLPFATGMLAWLFSLLITILLMLLLLFYLRRHHSL